MAKIIHSPLLGKGSRRVGAGHVVLNEPLPETGLDVNTAKENSVVDISESDEELMLANKRIVELEAELEELKSDIDKHRENALSDGLEQAKNVAMAQIDKEYKDKVNSLKKLLSNLAEKEKDQLSEVEDVMIEIAYAAVAKVIAKSAASKELILSVIQSTANKISRKNKLLIRLSEFDYQQINENDAAKCISQSIDNVTLVIDEKVEMGGCIVESDAGNVDARLDVQLQHIKDVLLDVYSQRASQGS